MRTPVRARFAGLTLIVLFCLLAVLHVLVMAGLVPGEIVWGGRAAASGNVMVMEAAALLVTLLFVAIVALRLRALASPGLRVSVRVAMWVVVAYLALNLVANLASSVGTESLVFAPLTLVMLLLAVRVAIEPGPPTG